MQFKKVKLGAKRNIENGIIKNDSILYGTGRNWNRFDIILPSLIQGEYHLDLTTGNDNSYVDLDANIDY